MKSGCLLLSALAFLLTAQLTNAQGVYTLVDLGNYVNGTETTNLTLNKVFGLSINNKGQIVGSTMPMQATSSVAGPRAWIWDAVNGIRPLTALGIAPFISQAAGINDWGQVVGASTTAPISVDSTGRPIYTMHATLWATDGTPSDLGTLPGRSSSRALKINNQGQVVGMAEDGGLPHVFTWDNINGIQDLNKRLGLDALDVLGTVPLTCEALNDRGEITGYLIPTYDPVTREYRECAYLAGADEVVHHLDSLASTRFSCGFDINQKSEVVGALSPSGIDVPYRWSREAGLQFLPLTTGKVGGYARAINNNSWIVGQLHDGNYYVPALWDNSACYELNNLLLPGSGVTIGEAFDINDTGWITAEGLNSNHAYVLIPLFLTANTPQSILGPNQSTTVTLSLNAPASAAFNLALKASSTSVTVPATVTVPKGARTATFSLKTGTSIPATTPVTVTASYKTLSQSLALSVRPAVTLSGTVWLQGTRRQSQPLVFTFREKFGKRAFSRTVTSNSSGGFSFSDIPAGDYNVSVKGSKWLRKSMWVAASRSSVSGLRFDLLVGDVAVNNEVDSADIQAIQKAMGSVRGGANWNDQADLNGDGVVNSRDLELAQSNLGRKGDF